jgi:DNA topoisomerase II
LLKYVRLFYPDSRENNMVSFASKNGDECVIIETGNCEKNIVDNVPNVSFVNGIYTKEGGVHVDVWRDAVFPRLVKILNARKAKKGTDFYKTSAVELYPYFLMFVRSEVNKPKFDTQTKDKLNSPMPILVNDTPKEQKAWSEYLNGIIGKMVKWNFLAFLDDKLAIKDLLKSKNKESTTDSIRKKPVGEKASHANLAGPKNYPHNLKCCAIITEGDSAKTFADAGRAVIQAHDIIGTIAIRGKFINVHRATRKQIEDNKEVQMLKDFLGLRNGVDYSIDENYNTLNYGQVKLMADQDDDGFHIIGLLINFFYRLWPELIEKRNYLGSRSTAIVKVTFKDGSGKPQTILHFSNPDYKSWLTLNPDIKIVDCKYYKGLGTYRSEEALPYFENPKDITYFMDGEESEYMELGFSKLTSDMRKEWITRDMIKPGTLALTEPDETKTIVDGDMSLATFVDTKLIIYHRMTIERAIPSLFDGFKDAGRKIFYSLSTEMNVNEKAGKVVMLAGNVLKHGYHHGEASLYGTMIKMAQGFVGTNNIPLLVNDGQFGSRMCGGKDAASPRYIYSKIEEIARSIFSSKDEPLLERNVDDDNNQQEFTHYIPIIPMILVNGAEGIACGFRTSVPCYNPDDLILRIEAWMNGTLDEMPPLKPWYRGFTGEIELINDDAGKITSWVSKGTLNKMDKKEKNVSWWEITELPIGLWTGKMKRYIEYLLTGTPSASGDKKKSAEKYLRDFKEYHTANTVRFEILPTKDFIPDTKIKGNFSCLEAKRSFNNIIALDENGYPRKYKSPEALLVDFCKVRLEYYDKRKKYWLAELKKEERKANNKYVFVKAVAIDKTLDLYNSGHLEEDMLELGLEMLGDTPSFDYLLSLQMRSMTPKKLEDLKKETEKIRGEIDALSSKSAKDLWREDLDNFKKAYAKFTKTRQDDVIMKTTVKKTTAKNTTAKKTTATKRKPEKK